ncbi:MAG: hypothetical protein J1F03_06930 [Oscillospiraceae bacterium]|nr:hypothetical protein [Oscillospiraceae bacterium]
MKDILKVMRFDFLTAKPLAFRGFIIVAVICFTLSLFFSPLITSYITFAVLIFIIPLQSVADKSSFNKLYGILPVKRKNITRARFLYLFLAYFFAELLEAVLAVISFNLKMYKLLPNQDGEAVQLFKESFEDTTLIYVMIIGVFAFICLMFSYMEMMAQIFGRENEMKIILITLGVLTAIAILLSVLNNYDMLPPINVPKLPEDIGGRTIVAVIINVIMLGICLLFGEITASKLAKREL